MDLGKIGMTTEGEYDPEKIYQNLDVVSFDGSSFTSRIKNNREPLNNLEAWQVSAMKGDTPELLYNNDFESKAVGNVQAVDENTSDFITYKETEYWFDGSTMNPSKVDGVAYLENENKYLVSSKYLLGLPFNAKEIGLIPDSDNNGGGTDNSATLNNFLVKLNNLGGGTIFFPKGWYLFKSKITVYDRIKFVGDESGNILEYKFANKPSTTFVFDFNGIGIGGDELNPSTCFFSGIDNVNLTTVTNTKLLDLTKIQYSTFNSCSFSGKYGDVETGIRNGIGLVGKSDGTSNCFNDCNFEYLKNGVINDTEEGKPFDLNRFNSCTFHVIDEAVTLRSDSDNNFFTNCSFAYNKKDIILLNTHCNSFINCRLEGTFTESVYIDANSSNNYFRVSSLVNPNKAAGLTSRVRDLGKKNTFHFSSDTSHYGTPIDLYPQQKESGWTKQKGVNYITDSYSISDTFNEFGSAPTKSYLTEKFENFRVVRLVSTGENYTSIRVNPELIKELKSGDELTAAIWVRSNQNCNSILRAMQVKTDLNDFEVASQYVHVTDNKFHLCSVTFRILDDFKFDSASSLYIRLFIDSGQTIDISKPMLYKGSLIYNCEGDRFLVDKMNKFSTSKLPILTSDDVAITVFNTDLNLPVFWDGNAWKKYDGIPI